MKIKKDYALRQVANTWVVLPLAEETVNFSGMLTLNQSGVMLWRILENGCDKSALVDALVSEYEVSTEIAQADVEEFLNKLVQIGCIEEE